ncbi:hypothetical protein WICMUC_003117 [Wickerhamomyces mucosus]|uniref:Uncharacterized protein n=1 Tax=Wickerhamomyces mucosus TaxID=1378264 RepID=A0A9P8TD34_9ASCO|nr:hypothetical protein WICMUC_003117 [Wickerhamomyces mucosus]
MNVETSPIPLINPNKLKPKTITLSSRKSDVQTGVVLLITAISVFTISILLLFDVISIPNQLFYDSKLEEDNDFPIDNYYTYAILSIPVMAWIWAVISWTGLKLFKHARGGKMKLK